MKKMKQKKSPRKSPKADISKKTPTGLKSTGPVTRSSEKKPQKDEVEKNETPSKKRVESITESAEKQVEKKMLKKVKQRKQLLQNFL